MGRWSGVVVCHPCLGSRGTWQRRCLAPESAGCMQASFAPGLHWGCARLIKGMAEPCLSGVPGEAGRSCKCISGHRGRLSSPVWLTTMWDPQCSWIQRPQNSSLPLPSSVFQAKFQEIVYLSLRYSQLRTGDGVPTGNQGSHGLCWLAFPFLSQICRPHLPLGMLPAEPGRVWPCRAASESPACSSGSGWRCG